MSVMNDDSLMIAVIGGVLVRLGGLLQNAAKRSVVLCDSVRFVE